ncbi:hypothetical protein AUJ66_03575 [Candidatus Desantisbacteria bacterium CG1_02_38_46]|uniref:Uncharacterized protein n=3 Tax=unclassified Candidatus Desantisiibacteriota TaxID=3106372 RepID=A0A2H9PEQ1_9BACT|nr:MAG: hypothetical protein AUJ66_03575 [Candidatus Desantisbacteria bacterium CG1_02_38_46]PIU51076.1 MAG: hypothetical protein COS91_06375 [Candidatus Desantisbacteria bacterium CG07_land_8_20_14_0_80_39_15]PIZ17357.1 MAG: hypothetical protein COY51_00365 [Candidatus Desantisbacteria bacterium CG_4_10_14_0_8_um_filter_39_17]
MSPFAYLLSTLLGIVVTVSLVLVQMAANRYLPQIIDLFFNWKVYLVPFCTFIFSIVYINVSHQISFIHLPNLDIFLFFLSIGLLVPYFYLLFDFLKPANIIKRISNDAIKFLNQGRRKKMEEMIANIGRMGKSSIQYMISEIPIVAINSERNIMCRHLLLKNELSEEWFNVDEEDFPGTPPQAIAEIKKNKTWLEMKIFHDFVTMFTFILNSSYKLRDVITSILINVRILGEKAQEVDDRPTLNLSLKFFNTFCRLALNSRDRAIIYNIFYQYRLLAETLFKNYEGTSLRIASFIKYYGVTAEDAGVPYILETGIYDLMMLNCVTSEKKTGMRNALLDEFLSLGILYKKRKNERILRDFRKRCLMLGGFYLLKGDTVFALRITEVLKEMPMEVIKEIERELLEVKDQDFWEITDRIINFDYVDAEHKAKIREFVDKLK